MGEGASGTRQPLDQSGGISSKSSERRTPCQTATSDLSTPSTSSSPLLYVHGDRTDCWGLLGEPRTSTSTFTQRLSSALVVLLLLLFVCCLLSHHLCRPALLPRRSSQHPPHPATPRTHSASWPHPQRSTGSDVRPLVGCHPKETLHCCRVSSVVLSNACSD